MIVASSAIGLPPRDRRVAPPPKNIAKRDDHHDRRRQRRGDRADQDVAVLHVRQLVREHAFELVVGQDLQDAFGGGHGRVLGIAAGGERVRRRLRNDVAPRHRQAGALRQSWRRSGRAGGRARLPVALYIRRTILSENQYDAKFVTTANMKPSTRPCAPPSDFAEEQEQGAHRAEQQRRLYSVWHGFYSTETRDRAARRFRGGIIR